MNKIRNYYLFADASPAGGEGSDPIVHHRASISLARIVRNRGQRLIVQADMATTVAVLFACAEYHQPTTVESPIPVPEKLLHVLPPIGVQERFVEATWLNGFEERQSQESEDAGSPLNYLAALANALDRDVQKDQRRDFQVDRRSLERFFAEYPPEFVTVLGSSGALRDAAAAALRVSSELSTPFYIDGEFDIEREFEVDREQRISKIEKMLPKAVTEFHWDRKELLERGQDLNFLMIQEAEREARLHIALELLVNDNDDNLDRR